MIGSYINGNYKVTIYEDGTKVRETLDPEATEFIPEFAENCDVKITDRCDGNCPMCYEGCTKDGKHADLRHTILDLDSLHPYTELALNGNDLSHPHLVWFLDELKKRKVIANMTVNQIHFEKHKNYLKAMIDRGLIHGLGISLRNPTEDFIKKVKEFPNAVIHVINGVITPEQWYVLCDNNLKVLILGYKRTGRGKAYLEGHFDDVKNNVDFTVKMLPMLINHFKVVSFDNLAIEQLGVRHLISDEKWDEFYMGDDGSHTFYMDLVENTFSKNSITDERWYMLPNIDDMFHIIRDEKKREESE